jgi:iron complex outermembrane receptor protein
LLRAQQQQRIDPLKQLSLDELANIEVVTVSKEPTVLQRTPAAVHVLSQEDIRRSGATSLPEVLRMVPGVEVARIQSGFWAVGVRGFGSRLSRSLLVLIDGRSVYTPLFAGVYWEVQDTPLEDIERIEVIRGPGGTIWGPNAVNGVINIITRHAQDTIGLLATAGGGNVDQGTATVRYGASKGNGFYYRVYGKGFTRRPEFHADGRNFDDWRMAQGGFRTDWNRNNRDALTVQGDLYKGEVGTLLGITTYDPPVATPVEGNSEVSGGNLLADWRRTIAPGSDIQLLTYYDRTYRRDLNFQEARNTFDIDFIHRIAPRQRQRITWGLGARFSHSDTTVVVPTVVFSPNDVTDKLYSAFVQDEISLVGDMLTLTLGSKFLHNNYSGFEIQPSARVLYAPTQRQTLWGAISRAVRAPSRVEEHLLFTAAFIPSLPAFIRLTGDGGFTSEQLLGYELGYRRFVGNDLFVDVSAFFNDYNDLLSVEANSPFTETSPAPTHTILPVLLRNLLRGTSSGVEIAPNWTVNSRWRLKGSYSFLHLDLERKPGSIDGSTVDNTEGSSPAHQVTLQSWLQLPRNVEFDVSYRYVSALPAQGAPAYSTAGIRLGWSPLERVEFSFSGDNLFQPHHVEFGSASQIKRSAYGKITWRR